MCARLPQSKYSARRVLDHRHATYSHDIERFLHQRRAGILCFRRGFVRTSYGDVRKPVWRNTLSGHVRGHLIERADVFPILLQHRVDHAWANRSVKETPPKTFSIEFLGAIAVTSSQIDPTKGAGRILWCLLLSCFAH